MTQAKFEQMLKQMEEEGANNETAHEELQEVINRNCGDALAYVVDQESISYGEIAQLEEAWLTGFYKAEGLKEEEEK